MGTHKSLHTTGGGGEYFSVLVEKKKELKIKKDSHLILGAMLVDLACELKKKKKFKYNILYIDPSTSEVKNCLKIFNL